MINNIQKLFKITAALVIGSVILWSCEPDADQLGSQFFQNGAQGNEVEYPLIAYNINNGDSVRADADRLKLATLGAFSESQFGLQKSAYVTQARLSFYAPDFGTNAVLDSAVMVLKPVFATDSVTTTTVEDFVYPIDNVPAKKVVNNFPVVKYGKTKIGGKTTFNINIQEVTEFLGSSTASVLSNRTVTTGATLGTKIFNGSINGFKITKDSDASTILERDPSLRIKMDSTFFQSKIISKTGSSDLADAASFIRYFKGLRISVAENDGYIFNINPNDVVINLYYKKDKVDAGVTTREVATFALNLGSGNTHFSQITYDRTGTPSAAAITGANQIEGDKKIYAQGMGGAGIGLRVPAATVSAIKELYKNDKVGIIGARLRVYTDASSWSNTFAKPDSFVVRQRDLTPDAGQSEYHLDGFLTEVSSFALNSAYRLVRAYDLDKNPAYYDVAITQTFKDIIEKEAENHDIVLNVGQYTTDATGTALLGSVNSSLGAQNFNSRSYAPYRAVFVGTDPTNDKSAKLILTYGKK